jgi:parallel beta helix pectate lyase-like protein
MRRFNITGTGLGLVAAFVFLGAFLVACQASGGSPRPTLRTCTKVARPLAGIARLHRHRAGPVQRLVNSLRPGQTGCVRSGTYVENVTVSRSDIALRPYPGEHARIVGRLYFRHRAHDDIVSGLILDGRNARRLPSPTVDGTRIRFTHVNVTNERTSICFAIGSSRYGRARGVVIDHSRIHACGRRPADNTEHGIYVDAADDTRIIDNFVYDNADRGIQLYPDAQHTLIERNVIDGNGEGVIFSGDHGHASNHNVVRHNVITNAQIRAEVESWYPPGNPRGVGNVVRENCLFGGRATIATHFGGFSATMNVIADPQYADPAAGDFSIPASNPCARVLAGGAPDLHAALAAPQVP